METNILILPGIGSSGPDHWQTLWEKANPSFIRVEQADWDAPACSDWGDRLETAVALAGPNTLLVAHSMACLLVAHWAATTQLTIKGALLVAIPDPAEDMFPPGASGFTPIPHKPLPFKSIVVASGNDPFGSTDFNRSCASAWGSDFVEAGDIGHINSDSGIGEWAHGFEIFRKLLQQA